MKILDRLKSTIGEFIAWAIKALSSIDRKLIKTTVANPGHYRDLTPALNADTKGKYSEAILWAIRNPNIKNMALTGPYGSGKSSIIRTFQANHREFKYLNLSLASFDDSNKKKTKIEQSLLQQLFYHEKNGTIPDSRFKKIKKFTLTNQLLLTVSILLWSLSIIWIFFSKNMSKITGWESDVYVGADVFGFLAFFIFFSGCFWIVFKVSRTVISLKLSKFKAYDAEIELDPRGKTSILNQHLEEIIYFFEVTKYDVIVIEDLDRFNNAEIFVTLRELNTLINNSKQIGRTIKFVYAVKDDLFHSNKYERSKFFDFIIPIIPIINTSNNHEQFTKLLQFVEFDTSICEGFISEVSLFIDDMRLLINITNEFALYKEILSDNLNPVKLLSIIIYKNCCPKDFARLHSNTGMLFNAFDKKDTLVKVAMNEAENELKILQDYLNNTNALFARNIYELNAAYVGKLIEAAASNNALFFYYKDNQIHVPELLSGDVFRNATKEDRFKNSDNHFIITFKDIEKQVDPEQTYNERRNLLDAKNEGEQERIKAEIEKLKKRISEIGIWTISEVFEFLPIQQIDELLSSSAEAGEANLLTNKLLVYLIRNAHIDERYDLYLSHFYSGSLTENDRLFILGVLNRNERGFDSEIDNARNVLRKILPAHFKTPFVLNVHLLNHLVTNKTADNEKYKLIIEQLSNGKEISLNFVDHYFSRGKESRLFLKDLVISWKGLFKWTVIDSNFTKQHKNEYFKAMLSENDLYDIEEQNIDQVVAEYISDAKMIEDLLGNVASQEMVVKLSQLIQKLKVRFFQLEDLDKYATLFEAVYKHNLYEINDRMIGVMMSPSLLDPQLLYTSNYTTIKEKGPELLIFYIDSNLNEYAENVLYPLYTSIEEDDKYLIELLTSKDVILETKEMILMRQKNKIESIVDVATDVQLLILSFNKVMARWENIFSYYGNHNFDNSLIEFINNEENYSILFNIEINDEFELKYPGYEGFFLEFLLLDQVSDNAYCSFLKVYNYTLVDESEIGHLSSNKIEALIKTKTLVGTAYYFNSLKTQHPGFHIQLMELNPAYLKEIDDNYEITGEDCEALLRSSKISDDHKKELIRKLTKYTSLNEHQNLSKEFTKFILKYPELALEQAILPYLNVWFKEYKMKLSLLKNVCNEVVSREQINSLLLVLGDSFSVFSNQTDFEVTKTNENIEILKILTGKYVNDWNMRGGVIDVRLEDNENSE